MGTHLKVPAIEHIWTLTVGQYSPISWQLTSQISLLMPVLSCAASIKSSGNGGPSHSFTHTSIATPHCGDIYLSTWLCMTQPSSFVPCTRPSQYPTVRGSLFNSNPSCLLRASAMCSCTKPSQTTLHSHPPLDHCVDHWLLKLNLTNNYETLSSFGVCSGKPPCYDKPSLKVKWTVKDVSATSARQRQVTPNYSVLTGGFCKRMSLIQGPGEGSQWGVEVESKRTSWIVRATILGFIYTLDVLLSKLSRSVSSK